MIIYDSYGNVIGETGGGAFWKNQNNAYYWVLHLDCARKYFSVANIKTLLSMMSNAGLNQIQLHFSENEGFRLALDNPIVKTENGVTYDLSSCYGGQESPSSWYTETDMDEIIAYAHSLGIDVVPSFDMPHHMRWLLRTTGVGSGNTLDLTNPTQIAFAKAIAKKYAIYFREKGCSIYNLGFDEAGFSTLYDNNQFDEVVDFANQMATMLKDIGLTPRLYNDAVHFNNDFEYFFDRDFQILYWAQQSRGTSPATLQRMGYTMINNTIGLYWVTSGSKVTPEAIANLDLLKGLHGGGLPRNGNGAVLSVWCDYDETDPNNGDGGTNIVTSLESVIEAFGTNLMNI